MRPLAAAVTRELDKYRRSPLEVEGRFASESKQEDMERFVQRLLNNNEPAYFYLHEELSAGVAGSHCAFLRLSIPIRSSEHYDKCLEAKALQLDSEFQAKLGWMVGNLYSRVGTRDWVPTVEGEGEFKARVERLLTDHTIWVPENKHKALVKALKQLPSPINVEQVAEELAKIQIKPKKEQLLERLSVLLDQAGIAGAAKKQLLNQVRNDQLLSLIIK